MGKKGGGSAPQAPDPKATSAAQAAANKETAIAQSQLNMINQNTPFGNLTYEQTGKGEDGTPTFTATTTLSPEQQALLNQQQEITGSIYGIGLDQLGKLGTTLGGDFPAANDETRQRVEDAYFNRAKSQLDPVYEQNLNRLETQLLNQGFSRGSAAYQQELDNFRRSQGDAYGNAANDAILYGGQEQSRLFGLESAARSQPINELAVLLGQSSGVQSPQFAATPQTGIATTDVAGPIYSNYQGQMNAYNQGQSAQNSLYGSLAGLGGTLGGAWILSDPDKKTDKEAIDMAKVLAEVKDLPVEQWAYKDDPTGQKHIGPYADDFAAAFGGDGKTIDVPTMFGINLAAVKELAKEVDGLKRRVS